MSAPPANKLPTCPVCHRQVGTLSLESFSAHVNECLERQTREDNARASAVVGYGEAPPLGPAGHGPAPLPPAAPLSLRPPGALPPQPTGTSPTSEQIAEDERLARRLAAEEASRAYPASYATAVPPPPPVLQPGVAYPPAGYAPQVVHYSYPRTSYVPVPAPSVRHVYVTRPRRWYRRHHCCGHHCYY